MEAILRRNASAKIAGEGVWALGSSMVAPSTVFALLLLRHGAGEVMIGAITAITILGGTLPQLVAMRLFRDYESRQSRLIWWYCLGVCPFFALSGIVLLFESYTTPGQLRWILLGLFVCLQVGLGLAASAWWDWMAQIFPRQWRGRIIGLSTGVASLTSAAGSLFAGWILTSRHPDFAYVFLFLLTSILTFSGMLFFFLIRDPARGVPSPHPVIPIRKMIARFAISLEDPNFRDFLASRTLATWGFSIQPFIVLYYLLPTGGEVPKGLIVTVSSLQWLGTAVSAYLAGLLGDIRGHKISLVFSVILQVIVLLILLTTDGLASAAAVFLMSGLAIGSGMVAVNNLILESCPHDHRLSHITVSNILLAFLAAPAPIVAGFVARSYDLSTLFVISCLLSTAGLAWTALKMKEPRRLMRYLDG